MYRLAAFFTVRRLCLSLLKNNKYLYMFFPTCEAKTITKDLDDFISNNLALSKTSLILQYLQGLGAEINNSQLLSAEIVYLFFAGE